METSTLPRTKDAFLKEVQRLHKEGVNIAFTYSPGHPLFDELFTEQYYPCRFLTVNKKTELQSHLVYKINVGDIVLMFLAEIDDRSLITDCDIRYTLIPIL